MSEIVKVGYIRNTQTGETRDMLYEHIVSIDDGCDYWRAVDIEDGRYPDDEFNPCGKNFKNFEVVFEADETCPAYGLAYEEYLNTVLYRVGLESGYRMREYELKLPSAEKLPEYLDLYQFGLEDGYKLREDELKPPSVEQLPGYLDLYWRCMATEPEPSIWIPAAV